MNLLAIDTSTEQASVALHTSTSFSHREQGAQRQHAQLLLPMIEQLLAETELTVSQLDGIVFGRGPGSFTGLRIACSVAKGLGYAYDTPLFPVSSLAAIANEVVREENAVLAMLDARMNQVYWAYFTEAQTLAEEHVSAAEDITFVGDKPLILAGVGYESYLSKLPIQVQTQIVSHYECYPSVRAMISLVLSGKIIAVHAADAMPVYIRNQVTQGD